MIPEDIAKLNAEISDLKKVHNGVRLVHNYQRPEVQDMGDFVGDSLGLAQQAVETDAEIIVLCGVDFMAETAKLLNMEKTVLLPEIAASCPMAEMVRGEDIEELRAENPGAVVVSYVNTTAETKAHTDICCTSANAVNVVNSIPADKPIIFTPDTNLGHYIQRETGRENMVIWSGLCPTHHIMTADMVHDAKREHPDAVVVVHPECRMEVIELADAVRSTGGMLKFCGETDAKEILVGTERGMLYPLSKACPDKMFYPIAEEVFCPTMKMGTLTHLRDALKLKRYEITVAEEYIEPARRSIERMLEISRG